MPDATPVTTPDELPIVATEVAEEDQVPKKGVGAPAPEVTELDENVTVLPTQTELAPVTVPVSVKRYTVSTRVAVMEPHEFDTV